MACDETKGKRKMSKLIALFSVYNAQDLIYEALTSVGQLVDEIRIYDGRFTEYKCECGNEHNYSCDGTLDEVKKWVHDQDGLPTVITIKLPAMTETAKRSKMFDDMEFGDVALVMDDDELFFGDPRPVKDFANGPLAKFAYIDFLFAEAGHGTGATIPLARLYRKTPGLRYGQDYFHVLDDEGLVVDMKFDNRGIPYGHRAGGRFYIHPSARIVSLWNYRNRKRTKAREEWLAALSKTAWGNR